MVDKPSAREAKRLQTRERLMGAAIAEFKRSGMAESDVGAIVTAAGGPYHSPRIVAHRVLPFAMVDTLLLSLELESVRRSTVEFTKLVTRRFRR
jgi:hypothetical protein